MMSSVDDSMVSDRVRKIRLDMDSTPIEEKQKQRAHIKPNPKVSGADSWTSGKSVVLEKKEISQDPSKLGFNVGKSASA